MEINQTVYLVKYATTQGVLEKVVASTSKGLYVRLEGDRWSLFTIGKEVVESREEADAIAKSMVIKKIKSLEKQAAKLRKDWDIS